MSDTPILLWPDLGAVSGRLELSGDPHHHLCRVLRLREGDSLELRDGRGAVAAASIVSLLRSSAALAVEAPLHPPIPPRPRLFLALPLLKGKRLDWVLEKGTELGVAGFRLFVGRHGVVRRAKAPERYRELIASAFCQSRGLLLPALGEPLPFGELLAESVGAGMRHFWADERLAGLGDGLDRAPGPEAGELLAWVGPEGGFSESEREALAGAGAVSLSLGPQRLRSETAALALACRFLLPAGGA
jgi:16S rRNA (uracil1498-N3)-methyltransferase